MLKAATLVAVLGLLASQAIGYPGAPYFTPIVVEETEDVYWGPSYQLVPAVDDNQFAVINDLIDGVAKRSGGQTESLEDGHGMEKRLYVPREGFRPQKRSMAIGRAGMRPGKRGQLSESYFPRNPFLSHNE